MTSNIPDKETITLSYSAPFSLDNCPKLKLPQRAMRFAKIAMTVDILLLSWACFAVDASLAFAIVGSLISGITGLIASMLANSRNQDPRLASGERIPTRRVITSLALSLALILVAIATGLHGYECLRLGVLSAVTNANLRGIGQALAQYENDHDIIPLSLDDLVKDNLTTQKQLISLLDPNNYAVLINGGTSFVYNPAPVGTNDPDIIVAYEPQPWSRRDIRLFPENGHAVLFADGHASFLSPRELTVALAVDKGKRANIGN